MPNAYFHGVTPHELTEGPVFYRRADFSSIGLIASTDDADPDTFEAFKPTFLTGTSALALAGTTGTLPNALDSIYDQIAPRILVVTIPATAADDAEMEANKILAVRALETAQSMFGFKPRILGAPGLESLALQQELVSMADRTRAFFYGLALAATPEDAVLYRANFGSKRGMLFYPSFDDADPDQSIRTIAAVLGLRSKIDDERGIARCISNLPIQTNLSGVTDAIDWDLLDKNTKANYLNENEITTIIKRDGWRFWGSRTLSAESEYAFESVVRKGDQLLETIAEAQFQVMGNKLVPALTTTLLDEVQRVLDQEKVRDELLGGKAYYAEGYNDITTLRDGQLHLHYDYTVPPPLEQMHLYAVNTGTYLVNALPGVDVA